MEEILFFFFEIIYNMIYSQGDVMVFQIISYIVLCFFSFLYTTHHYSSILDMIGCGLIIIILYGFLFYHYNFSWKFFSKKNYKKIIKVVVFSIVCSFFTFGQIGYSYKEQTIEIQNLSNQVVVIEAIYKDESKQKTHHRYQQKYDFINQGTLNTEYQRYNKMDEKYKATLGPSESYTIDVRKSENIRIEFQRKKESYDLLINQQLITVDPNLSELNPKASKIFHSSYDFEYYNIDKQVPIWKMICISVLSLFIYFNIFIRVIDHKNGLLIVLFSLLTEWNPFVQIHIITKGILLVLYFLFLLRYNQVWKFKNRRQKLLVLISSLYLSFSFFGDHLIQKGFNIKVLLVFFLFCIWIYLLFPYILNFLHHVKVKIQNKERSRFHIWKHRFIVFFIVVLIGIFYQFVFNPYIVPPDGYMQITDIQANLLSDWHPYLHTLFMKLFDILFGDVKYFITFRIFVYSAILTNILFYFYYRNLSLKKIYILAISFTLLPVTGILLVTMWKDIDFSLALLYLTFLLFLIIKDFSYFHHNKLNYLFLVLSLIGVGAFRHNGLIVITFVIILLFILAIKQKKWLILVSVIITISAMVIIKYPLYKRLNVTPAPKNIEISTILHGFDRLIYLENDKIDQEAYDYLLLQMPLQKWKESYDPYNIDLLLHYTDYDIRDMDIDHKKVILFYLKQFTQTPIELLKDRLYGIDLIWNVGEKDHVMAYKYQIYHDEFETNYAEGIGIKEKQNPCMEFINNLLVGISNNEILNILFFRVGIYIDILIILVTYILLTKKKNTLLILLPLVLNLGTLFLVMHHYEYRYVWNIELIILLFILVFIYDIQNKSERLEIQNETRRKHVKSRKKSIRKSKS